MSRVDVLAVMDAEIRRLELLPMLPRRTTRLKAAHAAVVELIAAAKARRDSVTLLQEREANARLDAALARVQP